MIRSRARWLGVLCLAVAMALVVAACGSSDDDSSTAATSADAGSTTATCTPRHTFTTVSNGTLSAVIVDYMPFGGYADGAMTGVDGDMLAEIAKMECLDLTGREIDTAGAIAQVTSGRVDVAAGDWWRSHERLKEVNMSGPTFIDAMAVLSRDGYSSFSELEGKKVGDVQGYIWNAEARRVLGDNYKLYQSIDQVEQDLQNGRIDAAIVTVGQVGYQQSQGKFTDFRLELMRPDPRVTATTRAPQSGIPYARTNPELGAALSADIEELKANGTLARIVQKYGLPVAILRTGPPYLL